MGLFSTQRAPVRDIALQQYEPPVMQGGGAPRRGLFRRLGQTVTPDRMMIAGAALRDLGTGRAGALDQTISMQQQAAQANAAALAQAEERAATRDYRERALKQQNAPQQPEVQHDARSGTFWIPDPSAPEGYRILGRDPNWQPPRPLVQFGSAPEDGYDYED